MTWQKPGKVQTSMTLKTEKVQNKAWPCLLFQFEDSSDL